LLPSPTDYTFFCVKRKTHQDAAFWEFLDISCFYVNLDIELYVTLQLIEELNYEGSRADVDGGMLILYSIQFSFFVKSSHCHHHVSWTLGILFMYIDMFLQFYLQLGVHYKVKWFLIPCLVAESNRTSLGNAITLFRSSFLQPLLKACKVWIIV